MGVVRGRYVYTPDLLMLESHRPTSSPCWCSRGPSPLSLDRLQPYLHCHPDRQFASYVFHGLRDGFHIGFSHQSSLRSVPHNHPSSRENPSVITDHLRTELQLGRLIGPLPPLLASAVHISPMGLVPKHHSDKWRLVVDLSSPRNQSVNDGISPALCSLHYASIDNAVDIISHLGRATELVKLDLSNAYRIIPVHTDDQPLLAVSWQGNTYLDRSLPFGLRSAPKIFNAVADLLTWVLHCDGLPFVIHYLDDFLVFGAPGSNMATTMRPLAEATFTHIGAPIAHHKTEGPSTALTFLGIQIDTNLFQLSLPDDKVRRLQNLLSTWVYRKSCTRRELESLIGHLSHAATVIRPGRIFLRNLFSLLSRLSNPHHYARLNLATRADITWWQSLLLHWNGRSFFPPASPTSHLYSDASGLYGCGAYSTEVASWFQLQWPLAWLDTGITAKELVPIVVAAAMWGPRWSGQHICFHCDNEAVVTIIQNRRAHNTLLTQLLRCLFFYASMFQFHFSALHIPGVYNVLADAISRNNLTLLHSLIPQATQVAVPPAVSSFLLHTPDWGSPTWTAQFLYSLPTGYPQPHPTVTGLACAATRASARHTTYRHSHSRR